jgi:hypothetical protein
MNARRLALAIVLLLSGCTTLRFVKPLVDGPNGVQVRLKDIQDDVFLLEVVNLGEAPIMVDRDRVVLSTPSGTRARKTGGLSNLYTILPAGHHAVNVRFNLGGLKNGDRIGICFADAIVLAGGQRVEVPPIELAVE